MINIMILYKIDLQIDWSFSAGIEKYLKEVKNDFAKLK